MPRTRADWRLLAGLGLVIVVAAVLRIVHLGDHLPTLVAPDEPTVMDRAIDLVRGRGGPNLYDWPPASMNLLALLMKAFGHVGSYLFGRGVFVAVSLIVVALTGYLGFALADDGPTARRYTAWGAAGLMAVGYVSVRLSRQVHPDHLQAAFVAGSLLCTFRYDADRSHRALAGAGVLAGLAAATKYLGGLVVLPAVVAACRRRADLAFLAAATVAGVLCGAPQVLTHAGQVWDGLSFQLSHESGGHLGYDGDGPSWWFHLTHSLPGNWGWPVTFLAVGGVVWCAVKGTRRQRLALVYIVPTFLVIGAARVRFPHYILPVVPVLAPYAIVAALRIAPRIRLTPLVAVTALALVVLPTVANDVRLVRTAGTDDTRIAASAARTRLPDDVPVWTERYGVLDGKRVTLVPALGDRPDVLGCRCVAVISSYVEERYRRESKRYAAQVWVYDAIRATGRIIETIRPSHLLRYDWDLLPDNGMGDVPLTGDVGLVGPTLTFVDLR